MEGKEEERKGGKKKGNKERRKRGREGSNPVAVAPVPLPQENLLTICENRDY